ncbi:MAG: hypothetical protein NTX64_15360 [Elusimicrobia bacterium]|nr:hypothetical protein [Elusimicrobiota bacterium]
MNADLPPPRFLEEPAAAEEKGIPPPGLNVHAVEARAARGCFWRGAAPRLDTLAALAKEAEVRGSGVTLVDLRHPDTADDRSGKDQRLSPSAEAQEAARLGLRYISISALDASLIDVLRTALRRGGVYMHCMYGVNRTGFAAARYSRAEQIRIGRDGLGERDWRDGDAFQSR